MGRFLVAVGVVALSCFAGYALVLALASDATRIRWRIEDMTSGFNDRRLSRVMAGVAPGFREETSGIDREELADALRAVFFEPRGEGGFPYRLEIFESDVVIRLDESEGKAKVKVAARLHERRGEGEQAVWEATFQLEMEEGEEGWQIVRARHSTTGGTGRWRHR